MMTSPLTTAALVRAIPAIVPAVTLQSFVDAVSRVAAELTAATPAGLLCNGSGGKVSSAPPVVS